MKKLTKAQQAVKDLLDSGDVYFLQNYDNYGQYWFVSNDTIVTSYRDVLQKGKKLSTSAAIAVTSSMTFQKINQFVGIYK